MVMVIGLQSGKEFLVKDKSYTFESNTTGEITKVFESIDNKRVISIPLYPSSIEYYDEEHTGEILAALEDNCEVEEVTEDVTDLYG